MIHEMTTVGREICVNDQQCSYDLGQGKLTGDKPWMYSRVPIATKRINQMVAEIPQPECTMKFIRTKSSHRRQG